MFPGLELLVVKARSLAQVAGESHHQAQQAPDPVAVSRS